jgi:hypothetical protein
VSDGRYRFEDRNLWLLTERWLGRFTRFDKNPYPEIQSSPENPSRPGVSVIVPTHQSLIYVVSVLERLLAHTGAQDEIVVVDRGSTDPTVFVARWLAEQHPARIKVVAAQASFVAEEDAWKIGLSASSRPYVALFPPLLWATLGWVDGLINHLEEDPALGMVGPMTDFATGLQEVGLLGLRLEGQVSSGELASKVRAAG